MYCLIIYSICFNAVRLGAVQYRQCWCPLAVPVNLFSHSLPVRFRVTRTDAPPQKAFEAFSNPDELHFYKEKRAIYTISNQSSLLLNASREMLYSPRLTDAQHYIMTTLWARVKSRGVGDYSSELPYTLHQLHAHNLGQKRIDSNFLSYWNYLAFYKAEVSTSCTFMSLLLAACEKSWSCSHCALRGYFAFCANLDVPRLNRWRERDARLPGKWATLKLVFSLCLYLSLLPDKCASDVRLDWSSGCAGNEHGRQTSSRSARAPRQPLAPHMGEETWALFLQTHAGKALLITEHVCLLGCCKGWVNRAEMGLLYQWQIQYKHITRLCNA